MKSVALSLASVLALAPALAAAQQPPAFTPDQKAYIAHHYCMMEAAMKASHGDARNEDVFALAQAACAGVRAQAVAVSREYPELLPALEAADAEKAANFPAWVKGVRERRASFNAKYGLAPSKP